MTIPNYIESISKRYRQGNATEHTFRGDLQQLVESLLPDIRATNEPKRQTCGAPDYILTKREVPVGFIEAKDIGDDDLAGAKKTGNKEQFDRYKASLNNILFTDYLDFHLYRDGKFVTKIAIAKVQNGSIIPLPQNFDAFTNLIKDFATHVGQTIKSPKKLAEMMAGKARLLSDVIEKAVNSDEANQQNSTLKDQMIAFKEILIHDITRKGFADIYAQTIVYGMFAARLHDPDLPTFSRQEAAELIPKSNPFLRKLFGYIAGPDIDDRIRWIVDGLVEIFLACNVAKILENYGSATRTENPIIHFYETFLSEYDPKLRKARGVWYTPHPVVSFIVRAVDDILKTEFNLPEGLADTSKTTIKVNLPVTDHRYKDNIKTIDQEVHRVQILDPATGTGTFLAEVVKHIYKKFEGMQGIWSDYVEKHLLPRLNGFELLMASYAMAHLQMDLLFTETGYKSESNQRLRVYLTNSLEEYHKDTGTLFANWLSTEANEANRIKRDTPVMVVMGNPPYSGISSNNGEWISSLIEDYKYIDGEHFNERKHWLNDDYVKFIRYGQHFIEKNSSGILAFIVPHGFLDNPTFRGMRWNLLKAFDKIYTVDLHGNTTKKETSPDGTMDENVFDIKQGVSINIFIKTDYKKRNELGSIFHYDLFGKRELKYKFLNASPLSEIDFIKLEPKKPFLFFVPKNTEGKEKYSSGFQITHLFEINVTGIVTARDAFAIDFNKTELKKRIEHFADLRDSDDYIRSKFFGNKKDGKYLSGDSRGWKLVEARKKLQNLNHEKLIRKISYRVFDDRFIYYHNSIIDWGREKYMHNFINKSNLGIDLCRQLVSSNYSHVFITNKIVDDSFVSNKSRERGYVFPLYLYPENSSQKRLDKVIERTPNLNSEIINQIAKNLNLTFTNEKETTEGEVCFANSEEVRPEFRLTFAPIDILDYIYAVLHSPAYREKYKEFLKIDFPRVPYPKDANTFWQLVALGGELRQIHLLESPIVSKFITTYPVTGDNEVTKLKYENGKVFINDTQYFDGVPEVAWNFYIGGYQPAQKWLKDRKGRKLEFEDILHYQKIIVALTETDRLMKEVDEVGVE